MSKTVGDILIGVLDDLGEAELKKFRRKLCDRKQEPKVRRGIVEKADPVDLVDILTRTFTEDGAVNVAIEVLGAINCQDVAEELTEFKKSYFTAQGSCVTSGDAMTSATGPKLNKDKHFVDHHRTALIDRVSQVEPLLDRLQDRGIITPNTYSEVRANKTNQKKMRELFDGPLKACGSKGKDIFLDILMELEPFLIRDLKGE
ncbi:apoptosis-associated speck-like protein containing a CARD isoform X1 [Salmo salar]|uniref:Apoptosis-associated speck-like protein containing a CARD n=1 Tax=Salmo salar TaxID=8030 RepID=B9EMD0_SALSA|nr:apoptosis-associated speck-like protein containing a CARD isoform X1 [Salmo salar]ACM08677.1 Apoptosis-associated speck-like protein containing a CARD [Salmo salar]|eukprot:XP_014020927.1 PREDICTED: apoptosis-associated speck-like protein containing a CARD isoform X1 [Salmo salar]